MASGVILDRGDNFKHWRTMGDAIMRKVIGAILITIFLSGWGYSQEYSVTEILPPEMEMVYEIARNCNLKAIEEEEGQDYWKAPFETERDGGGDCEDLSFWLLHKITNMGYDCWAVLGGDESETYHMWVRIKLGDGTYWDVDLVRRHLMRVFIEEPFNRQDLKKLQEMMERQEEYEKSKKGVN